MQLRGLPLGGGAGREPLGVSSSGLLQLFFFLLPPAILQVSFPTLVASRCYRACWRVQ